MQTHAMYLKQTGGTDALEWREATLGAPKAGEVQLVQAAVGLNFIDIYHRTGLYPLPSYPTILGLEAAGTITALGQGVEGFAVGDRVAYGCGPLGAYATARNTPASALVKLPDAVSFEAAAASLLKGLTCHYLLHQTYQVKAGDWVLLHAAAGGVGLLLSQWAKQLGARVIGVVSTPEKAALAKAHGCEEVLLSTHEHLSERIRKITGGQGVNVAYDSVGKDTLYTSLDSLAPLGMLVSFGQSSGALPPIDTRELAQRGSLFLTRPSLMDYMKPAGAQTKAADAFFAAVAAGHIRIPEPTRFALKDAAKAHEALQTRQTTGGCVLVS